MWITKILIQELVDVTGENKMALQSGIVFVFLWRSGNIYHFFL
jgi:hypothetical protein